MSTRVVRLRAHGWSGSEVEMLVTACLFEHSLSLMIRHLLAVCLLNIFMGLLSRNRRRLIIQLQTSLQAPSLLRRSLGAACLQSACAPP